MEAANADSLRYPASLTKLMTLYMAFEALKTHKVTLGQSVPVSGHAASMEPSKLGLLPGTYFHRQRRHTRHRHQIGQRRRLRARRVAGRGRGPLRQAMTLRARALGMTNSTFRNASGLPDPGADHHGARPGPAGAPPDPGLSRVLPLFQRAGVLLPRPRHTQPRPHAAEPIEGADGLKTGYTQAAGRNLVTSAMRGGVRLIGVVMGARSNPERDLHMASLLDDGFEQLGVPVTRHVPSRLPRSRRWWPRPMPCPSQPRACTSRHSATGIAATLHNCARPWPSPACMPALSPATISAVATCTVKPGHHGCGLSTSRTNAGRRHRKSHVCLPQGVEVSAPSLRRRTACFLTIATRPPPDHP